jgi:hypothetical protein
MMAVIDPVDCDKAANGFASAPVQTTDEDAAAEAA